MMKLAVLIGNRLPTVINRNNISSYTVSVMSLWGRTAEEEIERLRRDSKKNKSQTNKECNNKVMKLSAGPTGSADVWPDTPSCAGDCNPTAHLVQVLFPPTRARAQPTTTFCEWEFKQRFHLHKKITNRALPFLNKQPANSSEPRHSLSQPQSENQWTDACHFHRLHSTMVSITFPPKGYQHKMQKTLETLAGTKPSSKPPLP